MTTNQPTSQPAPESDTEAHRLNRGLRPADGTEDQDTESHRFRGGLRPADGTEDQDTEAHGRRFP